MEFVIIAYDSKDSDALNRRLAARADHFQGIQQLHRQGKATIGGAILDDHEKMIGSVLIVEVDSRQELDQILAQEPYLTQKVWENVQIFPMLIAPFFKAKLKGEEPVYPNPAEFSTV